MFQERTARVGHCDVSHTMFQERTARVGQCDVSHTMFQEMTAIGWTLWRAWSWSKLFANVISRRHYKDRDQARGRLGRNSCHRGRNFALNGTQGEVGVSQKK